MAALVYEGLLEFEFGFTAYATNTYLRQGHRAGTGCSKHRRRSIIDGAAAKAAGRP